MKLMEYTSPEVESIAFESLHIICESGGGQASGWNEQED